MGLRTREGVSLQEARARYGVDVWGRWGKDLAGFVREGCLKLLENGERLCLTSKGMRFGNLIFEVFVKA